MTGLTPGTFYHVRAYVTNDAATMYGEEVTFTSLIAPTVTTQAVTNILTTTRSGTEPLLLWGFPILPSMVCVGPLPPTPL